MLYAHKNGEISGAVPDGNDAWAANKKAAGFTVIEDERELDFTDYKVVDGEIVSKTEADKLPALKLQKQAQLLDSVNWFIQQKPDGTSRYDTNLKLNLMQAAMNAMAAGQAAPQPVVSVQTWFTAVQTEYFTIKATISAAQTIASLESIAISYQHFEARYGVSGTVLSDPDVYTADLGV